MLYPQLSTNPGLGQVCALLTDGRFPAAPRTCPIGHAFAGGSMWRCDWPGRGRDTIEIDIPHRSIQLAVADDELARRRAAMDAKGAMAWKPVDRRALCVCRLAEPMPHLPPRPIPAPCVM